MIVKFNPEKTGIGKFISIFGTKLPKVTEEVKTLFNTISTLPMTDRGNYTAIWMVLYHWKLFVT